MTKALIWLNEMGTSSFVFTGEHLARWRRELPGFPVDCVTTEQEFLALLPEAELVVLWRFRQEWFAQAPRLRWIATPAAGRDYFQVTPPEGVRITYGTFHGELMGETALAMLLAACRGVLPVALRGPDSPWARESVSGPMRLLGRSHLGILGFGHIGEWIGRFAKGFGARITGIRRQSRGTPGWFTAADRVLPVSELDRVLPELDQLMICLPRSPATELLLDRRRLGLLPRHAWLHNIGRGNCLDETALAEALAAGRLAGACLDVFREEPLPPESPLRRAPNVVLMPHISACAPEYLDIFLDEFVPVCRRWAAERPASAADD